uniref:Aspartate carbamoyltransferase n=1 Tax=Anthurium amnicola TaxID=1678845 RepID=A0A1D1XL23_9ARAE
MIRRNPRLPGLRPLVSGAVKRLLPSESPHQLLQSRPVSGTAKGKAKIKAGQQLKRSSIPKKKTSKSASGAPGGGGRAANESADRLSRMVDSCLNAPTPLRYLTAKQREREAEREKLGLISKERQREIDSAKAAAKKGPSSGKEEPALMGTPGLDLISLGLVDAEAVPKYELTVEDGRRLAKEYSRMLMRRHRARQAAESTLLRLKKEAIEALPEHLKAAALVPDLTPFPANRFMATLTPPIEGYVEKVREAAKTYVGKQKLR